MFDDEKEAIVRLKENSFVELLFGAEIHFSKIWLTDMPREKKGEVGVGRLLEEGAFHASFPVHDVR